MNRQERRQIMARVRAGVATPSELRGFVLNRVSIYGRSQGRREWRATIAALRGVTVYETKQQRNAAKRLRRAWRAGGKGSRS